MPTEDTGPSATPGAAGARASRTKVRPQDLTPHSDLTYRSLDGLLITAADLYQSLLTGVLIRDCDWSSVRFARSDLDGVRVERSTFDHCDFRTCDIRSSHFSKCTFASCVLAEGFIDDCEFHGCEFLDCDFGGSSTTGSRFYESRLRNCNLSPGTFLHNRLYRCTLEDMTLGDCTLLYLIFRDCTLRRVRLNAESVGAILGLTREQVRDVELVYLGAQEPPSRDKDIVEALVAEYERRGWHIGGLVHGLNFGVTSAVGAFDSYLSRAAARFGEMGFAKGDEVQFLGDVIEELAELKRLPLLVPIETLRWCTTLEADLGATHTAGSVDALKMLAARVTLLTSELLEKLEDALPGVQKGQGDTTLRLRVTFEDEPTISLHRLVNEATSASPLAPCQRTSLVRVASGSYVEVILTTLFSVIALQVLIYLVNGCLIQLTELKHRFKVLARDQPPQAYRELSVVPVQQPSPLVLSVLHGLTQYARSLAWLKSPSLGGYSAANIRSFEVLDVGREGWAAPSLPEARRENAANEGTGED